MLTLSPLDGSGKAVDWWFLYKTPTLKASTLTDASDGFDHVYFDAPTGLSVPKAELLSGESSLDFTLAALFKAPAASTGWILYNDEKPASAGGADNDSLGHTKGVIGFDIDSKTGFWLLHSWPKFPEPVVKQTTLPAANFGQTFLCLALDLDTIRALATQMANHQQPQTYSCRIPAGLPASDPIAALTQPLKPNSDPAASNAIDCKTRGGFPFKVIAKNRKWGRDFWNDLVAHVLSEDLDVETWIRGGDKVIPPNKDSDGPHSVYDIKYIDLHPLNKASDWSWPEHDDHAKWAISDNDDWLCVGDINRMISQEKRGGCTIAFQNEALWHLMSQTDLLVLPKGVTSEQALQALQTTHQREARVVRTKPAP